MSEHPFMLDETSDIRRYITWDKKLCQETDIWTIIK